MAEVIEVMGLVIASGPIGEYDKRVVLLTKELGKISAFARGARKPGSPLMAACESFAFGTFVIYPGRSSYTIEKAAINNYFREEIRQYKQLDYPHIGEKVICRKNNWKKSIDDGVFMTNGMTGYVDDVFKNTFDKKSMVMDFRPDFTNSVFKNIRFNYPYMYAIPTSALSEENNSSLDKALNDIYIDRFEYSYAITTHLSQGSQYNKVLFLNERMMRTKEDQIKLAYTAITRAIDSISIVV